METIEPKERERIIRDQADLRLNESLATISKLEAEIKELREAGKKLMDAMDDYWYDATDEAHKAHQELRQLLTKNEG